MGITFEPGVLNELLNHGPAILCMIDLTPETRTLAVRVSNVQYSSNDLP